MTLCILHFELQLPGKYCSLLTLQYLFLRDPYVRSHFCGDCVLQANKGNPLGIPSGIVTVLLAWRKKIGTAVGETVAKVPGTQIGLTTGPRPLKISRLLKKMIGENFKIYIKQQIYRTQHKCSLKVFLFILALVPSHNHFTECQIYLHMFAYIDLVNSKESRNNGSSNSLFCTGLAEVEKTMMWAHQKRHRKSLGMQKQSPQISSLETGIPM